MIKAKFLHALEERCFSELMECAHTLRAPQYNGRNNAPSEKLRAELRKIFDMPAHTVWYINVNNSCVHPNIWIGQCYGPASAQEMARRTITGVTFELRDRILTRLTPACVEQICDNKLRHVERAQHMAKRTMLDDAMPDRPRKGYKGHVSWKEQVMREWYGLD